MTLDVVDPASVAEFWCAALGYESRPDEGRSIQLVPAAGTIGPSIWLQPVDETKTGKLRCHIDLEAAEPAVEVDRLVGLGARRADVGQTGDESFVVMQDPAGNEFCVLGANQDKA